MPVFEIDPTQDPRWLTLLESHPHSSIFHTREWLEALRRTYRFRPRAFTTSPSNAPLTNAILFCEVRSWLTGSKLVSLPFSDHCEPLVDDPADLEELLHAIQEKAGKFKYAEIRPRCLQLEGSAWSAREQYVFHALDLRPGLQDIYARLHKDGVQRKIRRAEREGVVLEQGRSEVLLEQFYELLLKTRRRHRLPPQPFSWFRNLVECMGPRLTIHVARVGDRPIASVLMLRHRRSVVYKNGCSDERFHSLGGMPTLFWRAIEDAKSKGFEELDLGRSDESNLGLVKFKDHLGATRSTLRYWQVPKSAGGGMGAVLKSPVVQGVLLRLPDSLFRWAGSIFYRHAG